jgi:hypothetical protein
MAQQVDFQAPVVARLFRTSKAHRAIAERPLVPLASARRGVDRRFADAVLASFGISGMDGFGHVYQPDADPANSQE